MAGIIATLLVTSLMDSLNPSAIAQTLLFLGNERRKWKILVFILAMFLTNSVLGLAVYYGALAPLKAGYDGLKTQHPDLVFHLSLVLGILAILIGILLGLYKYFRTKKGKETEKRIEEKQETKEISILSMFFMGMLFTGVELTTALPYFGFLTGLVSHYLGFGIILLLIFLYSFVYVFPLLLVYALYVAFRNNRLIGKFEHLVGKVSAYILPLAFVLVGGMFLISIV